MDHVAIANAYSLELLNIKKRIKGLRESLHLGPKSSQWSHRTSLALLRAHALCALTFFIQTPAQSQSMGQNTPPVGTFNFFVSGHSLTDDPFSDYLAAVARNELYQVRWNQQIVLGAPIMGRTRGNPGIPIWWSGYKTGKNNGGYNMDVVADLKSSGNSKKYDFLIVAEGHRTVSVIRWNDTVRFLRHFHERLIEGNSAGTTYLYSPWESIRDISNPKQWIDLERDASTVWSCIAARINRSLEHEVRSDRVKVLPIAGGLAELARRLTTQPVLGPSDPSTSSSMRKLFSDDVHVTPVGYYYISLLSYIGITGRDPIKLWRPESVSKEQAIALKDIASSYLESQKKIRELSLPECINFMVNTFCDLWNAYGSSSDWRIPDCKKFFGRTTSSLSGFEVQNPFVFDRETEAGYWFKPPQQ